MGKTLQGATLSSPGFVIFTSAFHQILTLARANKELKMVQNSSIRWHLIFLAAFRHIGTAGACACSVCCVLFAPYGSGTTRSGALSAVCFPYASAFCVFLCTAAGVFGCVLGWIAVPNRAFLHGALISAILLTLDIVIVAVAGQLGSLMQPGMLLAHAAKVGAALLGRWSVQMKK